MTINDYFKAQKLNDEEAVKEYNKQLVEKYPWIIPPDRYDPLYKHPDEVNPNYDYSWTQLDGLPDGWRIAFQDQMCDEIQHEYEKLPEDQKKDYYIIQAKEKFGGMRLYMSFYAAEIEKIINKYSADSELICIVCGKPATKISMGWICPYCDEHIGNSNYESIESFYGEVDE